jgi:hypothetical protein
MQKGLVLRAALMGAAVTLAGSMLAPSARADIIGFDLTASNTAGLTGPFVHVQVNETTTTSATITFTSLTNGGNLYMMGGTSAADVNVSGSFSVGSFVFGAPFDAFSAATLASTSTGNADGFGSFNLNVNLFDGFTNSTDSISFVLTATGTNSWANAAAVLTPNNKSNEAAAHIFPCVVPCTANETVAQTAFASTPAPIVGAGLPGLMIACGGLIGLARRRRRRTV